MIEYRHLLRLGFTADAVKHAARNGELRRLWRGVYAVGPQEPSRYGRWMAAVLACGKGALLSHESAAQLFGVRPFTEGGPIDVSIPAGADRARPGVGVHRRRALRPSMWLGIPVTGIVDTLIDTAPGLSTDEIEAMIGEADIKGLTDPDKLRRGLDEVKARAGVGILKKVLDRRTYVMTHTHLERRFLPLAYRAGLPKPTTQRYLGSDRVDFVWFDVGLIVEVDGLTYHRTPAQQAKDQMRGQRRFAEDGLVPLRFSHWQIRYEPASVERALRSAAMRLLGRAPR